MARAGERLHGPDGAIYFLLKATTPLALTPDPAIALGRVREELNGWKVQAR